MRFFEETVVAPRMLVSEVVIWLALGRPPRAWFVESDQDIREDPDNFFETFDRYGIRWDGFNREEFQTIDSDIDFEEYEEVLFFEGMPHEIDGYLNLHGVDLFEYAKGIDRDPFEIRKEQDTARNNFLCRCDSYFDWHIDRAKITVLSQILGGLIETTGVIETVFDDVASYSEFEVINPKDWISENFDVLRSELSVGAKLFKMVQVETQKAFEIFPEPQLPYNDVQLRQVGSFLRASRHSALPQSRTRRGRPKLQTAELDQVIRNEFRRTLKAGLLSEKREAIIQEAMDWAQTVLTKDISRSTAQRILKPIFDICPK